MFGRKKETPEEKSKKILAKSAKERKEIEGRIKDIQKHHTVPRATSRVGGFLEGVTNSINSTEKNLGFTQGAFGLNDDLFGIGGSTRKSEAPVTERIIKPNGTVIIRQVKKKKQTSELDDLENFFMT